MFHSSLVHRCSTVVHVCKEFYWISTRLGCSTAVWFIICSTVVHVLMDVLRGSAGRDVPQLVHRVFHSWFTGAGTDTVTGTGTDACLGDRSGAVLLFIPRGCWDMCVSVIVFDKRQINRV